MYFKNSICQKCTIFSSTILINENLVVSSHDVSNGGLITALSEMVITSKYGAKIYKPKKLSNLFEYFFGEDQARYLVEIESNNSIKSKALSFNVSDVNV